MKKFAGFIFWLSGISFLLFCSIYVGMTILSSLEKSGQNLSYIFLLIGSIVLLLPSSVLIIVYEIITLDKLRSKEALENKEYKKLLLKRKILALLSIPLLFMVYSLLKYLFPLFQSGALLLLIPGIWWGLMAKSSAFELEYKVDNKIFFKKNWLYLILSTILTIFLACGSVTAFKYFSEMDAFSSYWSGKASIYLLNKNQAEIESILQKRYLNGKTPFHLSVGGDTPNLILATAFECEGDLFENVLTAKDSRGRFPRYLFGSAIDNSVKAEIDNKITCMRIAKFIEDPTVLDKDIIGIIKNEKVVINTYFPVTNKTLLNYAVENFRFELTKYLILKGASVNNQYTPIEWGAESHQLYKRPQTTSLYQVCNKLRKLPSIAGQYIDKSGVQPDAGSLTNSNSKESHEKIYNMLKLLLQNGADPYIPDERGITPFMIARQESGSLKIMKLFTQKGKN